MKRKVISAFIVLVLTLSICTQTFGVSRGVTYRPTLDFSGSMALCSVSISAPTLYIDAELELWEGNQLLASWPVNGMHAAGTSGSHQALSGYTYTLTITGTVGDLPINAIPITRTCP